MKKILVLIATLFLINILIPFSFADQQNGLSMSATVPASPSDFQAILTQDTTGSTFSQNTPISYTLSYGSNLSNPVSFSIQAAWTQGTIQGDSSPSVTILNYVSGSASNAYGSAPPVIDSINRTITWTITDFPANTQNKTVTFQLQTVNGYTGNLPVSFQVKARLLGPGATTTDSNIQATYQYDSPISPSPTPTSAPGPTSTSTPQPSTTYTPTPTPTIISIKNSIKVDITSISSQSITLDTSTTRPSAISIRYGTTPQALNKTLLQLGATLQRTTTIDSLNPNTQYYFQVTATNGQSTVVSDIFTAKTALSANAAVVNESSLVIVSNNVILYAPSSPNTPTISTSSHYEFKFSVGHSVAVKEISAYLVKTKSFSQSILAAQNPSQKTPAVSIEQIQPGSFVGRLQAPPEPGLYSLNISVYDTNNNLISHNLSNLAVSVPLSVREKGTETPIENAQLELFLFNSITKKYTLISPQILSIKNPSFSDNQGVFPVTLSAGKYKARVSTLGFHTRAVEFNLGNGQVYPIIELTREPFNILTTISFYAYSGLDALTLTREYVKSLAFSLRFFELFFFLGMLLLIVLAFFSFLTRSRISLTHLPLYIFHHMAPDKTLRFRILDADTKKPISKVTVQSIIQGKIHRLYTSDAAGIFILNAYHGQKLLLTKTDYIPLEIPTGDDKTIYMSSTSASFLKKDVVFVASLVFGFLLEAFLLLSILMEVIYIYIYGFWKVTPLLAITGIIIFLLVVHKRNQRITLS